MFICKDSDGNLFEGKTVGEANRKAEKEGYIKNFSDVEFFETKPVNVEITVVAEKSAVPVVKKSAVPVVKKSAVPVVKK